MDPRTFATFARFATRTAVAHTVTCTIAGLLASTFMDSSSSASAESPSESVSASVSASESSSSGGGAANELVVLREVGADVAGALVEEPAHA